MSVRRKIAIATWSAPREGNIYGKLVLDAEPVLKYLDELRAETGVHVTLTHVVIRALALTLREAIGLNGRIFMGRFIPNKTVDLSVAVAIDGGANLAMVKVERADELSILELANLLNAKTRSTREGKDREVNQQMSLARWTPWFILRPLVKLLGWISTPLGLSLPAMGVRSAPFGCALISNVGVFGVDEAFIPPVPFAHIPLYLLMGSVREAPYADQGEVKIRREITLTATLDHRFIDGAQAAVLARLLRQAFADPESLRIRN